MGRGNLPESHGELGYEAEISFAMLKARPRGLFSPSHLSAWILALVSTLFQLFENKLPIFGVDWRNRQAITAL